MMEGYSSVVMFVISLLMLAVILFIEISYLPTVAMLRKRKREVLNITEGGGAIDREVKLNQMNSK